jgi:large subunit ribosomal protein L22
MSEAHAILRFVRVAPRKAMLKHTPRHAARVVEKLLRSAVANAELKELGDSESMVVSRAFVNCGPTYKRVRARSMGRANAIQKRTSHITVAVTASERHGQKK